MSNPSQRAAVATLSDPETWVDTYGDALYRFALVRVRDESIAQDLVQETFLAALKPGVRYAGKSSEKWWLIGILRHKITDYFRRAGRETSFTDLDFLQDEQSHLFQEKGLAKDCWIHRLGPAHWAAADSQLDREEFWKVLDQCAGRLPHRVAKVFFLRELDGIEVDDICESLDLQPNHLYVMLYRARMALRYCLEKHWFKSEKP